MANITQTAENEASRVEITVCNYLGEQPNIKEPGNGSNNYARQYPLDNKRADIVTVYNNEAFIIIEAKYGTAAKHNEGIVQVKEYMNMVNHDIVIGIAVSKNTRGTWKYNAFWKDGDNIKNLKIDLEKGLAYLVEQTKKDKDVKSVKQKRKKLQDWKTKLTDSLAQLHEHVRNYCKAPNNEKTNLLNGAFIALKSDDFRNNLDVYEDVQYSRYLYEAIISVMHKESVDRLQKQNIKDSFAFLNIDTHPTNDKTVNGSILQIVKYNNKIMSFNKFLCLYIKHYILEPLKEEMQTMDISSLVYNEFIKYAKGDGSDLGIVLTPSHISELMIKLLDLQPEDRLLDICTGSGAFLVAGMKAEQDNSNTLEEESKCCTGLIGVELQPNMYALAVSNILFNGGDISNLYLGSCYEESIIEKIKELAPTKAVLNPPYAMYKGKGGDIRLHEWGFVQHALSLLPPGGKCICIIPTSCGIQNESVNNNFKQELLEEHTLDLIIQCPDQLFYPTGVVTNIYMFTAHVPHNKAHTTFTYNLKDDGFKVSRKLGRADTGLWYIKEKDFFDAYEKLEITPLSNKFNLKASDEWDFKMPDICPKFLTDDFIQMLKQFHNAIN